MAKVELVLQRQLRGVGRLVLVEHLEDLLPEAGLAPAVIASMDRLPGAELLGKIAPGGSGPPHPEHAGKHGAVIVGGATRARLLRREQWGDARPARIGEVRNGGSEGLDRERAVRGRPLVCPPCGVAAPGHRLVSTAKGRPGEPEAAAFRGLGEGEQQAADFRHRQRNPVDNTPFSSAVAWRRVTSR